MGQEIATTEFTAADEAGFAARLARETTAAQAAFARGGFAEEGFVAGFELEAWLIDHDFFPTPRNEAVLNRLADPLVVPELSRFNLELNGTPQPLRGRALSLLEAELAATWQRCVAAAHEEEATLVAIGILPTLREADLTLANMSPLKRFAALNARVLAARGGRPLQLNIEGAEPLHLTHPDVMLEAGTTSFQVHLQTPAREVARYLNASIILSAPLVALSANAPLLFGHRLWCETRIPLFEQAVDCTRDLAHTGRRVTFGRAYAGADPTEFFADNAAHYPPLLPIDCASPTAHYAHLRLHNGTVWRWNRLLIGDVESAPHLRIEQRVMPAGPSVADMLANAAFYYGAARWLATRAAAPEAALPFIAARKNFYAAARHGLDAEILWLDGDTHNVTDLLRRELLPNAMEALAGFGLDGDDLDRYAAILDARLRTRQNGAAWQLAHHARHGDLFRLTADYLEHQRSGAPVHEWPL